MSFTETFFSDSIDQFKDVVVVHGLAGGGDRPWVETDEGPPWLKKDLFEDCNVRVIGFSYDIELDNGMFVYDPRGLRTVARQLLHIVRSWREQSEANTPLAFLANDFGGMVVKMALAIASREGDTYSSIVTSTFALIFLGCPHRAVNLRSLTEDATKLFYSARHVPPSGFLGAAQLCATTIMYANDMFRESSLPLRVQIASVFSYESDTHKQVFDEFTATFHFSSEVRVGLQSPHNELLTGEDRKRAYKPLQKMLQISAEGMKTISEGLPGLEFLLSTVPPLFVPQVESYDSAASEPLSLIGLIDWMQQPDAPHTARYLSIPRSHSTSSAMIEFMQLVSDNIKSSRRADIKHFTFKFCKLRLQPGTKASNRFDGTRLALASFVAQAFALLLPHVSVDDLSRLPFRDLKVASSFCLTKPFLLRSFVLLNTLLWKFGIHAIWSIWNLEYCEGDNGPAGLVRTFTDCFRSTEFKPAILFAASEDSAFGLVETMDFLSVRPIDLELRNTSRLSSPDWLSEKIATLGAYSPILNNLPKDIRSSFLESKIDDSLRETFFRWTVRTAHSSFTKTQWVNQIEKAFDDKGELDPQALHSAILNSLSAEESITFKKIVRWTLCSCRPLSPFELIEALGLEYDIEAKPAAHHAEPTSDEHDGMSEDVSPYLSFDAIEESFSGVIRVMDNEVHLAHGLNLDTLTRLPLTDDNSWHIDEAETNFTILRCLLLHLSSQSRLHSSNHLPLESFHLSPFHHNLAAYAVHFWPHHYRLSQGHESTREKTEALLDSYSAAEPEVLSIMLQHQQEWKAEKLNCTESNGRALSVVALTRCGLSDIAEIGKFACRPSWEDDPTILLQALLHAVREGNGDLVKRLSLSSLGNEAANSVLISAREGDLKFDAMDHLFKETKTREGFTYPAEFIAHAIDIGMKEIVEVVQDYENDSLDRRELLLQAAQSKDFKTFSTLAGSAKPNLTDEGKDDVLRVALSNWEPTEMSVLIEGLSMNYTLEPLTIGIHCGNHLAVERLLAGTFESGLLDQEFIDILMDSILCQAVRLSAVEVIRAILQHIELSRDRENLQISLDLAVQTSASREICDLLLGTGIGLEDMDGDPYLYESVRTGNIELVKFFLEHEASVDGTPEGDIPLCLAAEKGWLSIVELLLTEGGDVNAQNYEGYTPLYNAAIENWPDVVSYLLKNGANILLTAGERDWSPLEAAYDFPAVLEHLVTKTSPAPDYKRLVMFGSCDVTALYLAARSGHAESVKLMLDHGDPDLEFTPEEDITDSETETGFTPLVIAAKKSYTDVVRLLLERGAMVNHHVVIGGKTALHYAQSEETIATLLEYGAGLEEKDDQKYTPLCWHAVEPNTNILRRLINAGANLETQDESGDTPLLNAVISGSADNIRLLVAKGAPVNGKGGRYGYPVHRACDWGRLELLKVLIDLKASLNVWCELHGTPLEAACRAPPSMKKEVVEYLVEEQCLDLNPYGSYFRSVMGQAFQTGTFEVIAYLLDHGCDVNTLDRTGTPSLFNICAREEDSVKILDMVVERFGDEILMDTRDHMSRSILHCAALSGHLDLIEKLIKLKPTLLQSQDKDGWTALHWAARRSVHLDTSDDTQDPDDDSKAEVMKLLVRERCPGLDKRVEAGGRIWTVMEIAKYHSAPEVVIDALKELMIDNDIAQDEQKAKQTDHSNWYCDGCLSRITGTLYKCNAESCWGQFGLCFKCERFRDKIHEPTHAFDKVGKRGW